MKLRIKGASIRLRLTKSEVHQIAETGVVSESTPFPGGGTFHYALRVTDDDARMAAVYREHTLTVSIPRELAREWTGTDRVSLEERQDLADGSQLRLLVEKDFACLKPRDDEDDSDAFPHPESEAKGHRHC